MFQSETYFYSNNLMPNDKIYKNQSGTHFIEILFLFLRKKKTIEINTNPITEYIDQYL